MLKSKHDHGLRALVFVVFFALTACAVQKDVKAPTPVFIMAGQSNMSGQTKIKNAPDGYMPLPKNVTFHDFTQTLNRRGFNAWVAGGETDTKDDFIGERGPGYYGAELGFIHKISEAYSGQEIIVIKWSLGGTGIDTWSPDWAVSDFPARSRNAVIGSLYGKSIKAIKDVKIDVGTEYKALVWFQGENDTLNEDNANAYGEKLTNLVAAYRRDLKAPDLHVLVGKINPISAKHHYVKEVQSQMAAVAASDPTVTVVAADGLTKRADGIHYDAMGSIKMGERFGEAWLNIKARSKD